MTEKTEKKKLIRITYDAKEVTGEVYAPAFNNGVCFAFVGAGEEMIDGYRTKKQISRFVTCREQLCEMPRSFLHKTNIYNMFPYQKYELDMTKLRLLIAVNRTTPYTKEHVFAAKKIINILEEEAGWPLSTITTVKHSLFKEDDKFWMLTGSEKWVKVPQMLSLICLIIRVGCKFGPLVANNTEEVRQAFNKITKMQLSPNDGRSTDKNYISTVRKHIVGLMKHMDEVFTEDSKYYYVSQNSTEGGWNGYGGIDSFCKQSTGNKKITADFSAFLSKYKGEE